MPIASSYLHIINKMFNKLKASIKKKAITWLDDKGEPSQNAMSGGYGSIADILGCTTHGSYDNNFPNITRISEAFSEVEPYAIDANGKRLTDQPHIIDILYNPNEEMSGPDFWETLMVMLLVHPIVYILCWHEEKGKNVAGGPITKDNISGLTFLENVSAVTVGGKTTYYCGTNTYTKEDVIALSLNVNPYSLLSGYSPSMAAKKWATADDCIADHQTSFFRNGAVPAGQFVITAPTVKAFNQCVDSLQAHHRGALNYNNPIYVHRPTSAIDGKPMAAQVEWVPFSQSTDTKTLQSIFDQANKKIDMDFGVPQEVKGYLQNSNYASVEVADYIFARRVVYPTLVKIYSKLTHELNRVTGGLGYALSFHYEVPMLTDTRKLQAEALKTMMDAGFTVETSVEALRLPESYKVLQLAPKTDIKKDLAPAKVVRAVYPTASKTEDTEPLPKEDLVSPNLLIAYDDLIRTVLADIEDSITGMIATYEEDSELDVEHELDLLEGKLAQTYHTDPDLNKDFTAIKTDLDHLRIGTIAKQAQALSAELGVEVETGSIGLETKKRIAEVVADDLYDSYRTTVKNLLNHTAEIIYRATSDGDKTTDELENQIIDELEQLGEKQHWRAVRFGFTEQQIVMSITAEMLWAWAQSEYQFKGYKTWHISPLSPAPCEGCIKTNGETVRIGEKFSSGVMYPPLHPNCYCYCEYSTGRTEEDRGVRCGASDDATDEAPRDARRVRARRSASNTNIKITCPKCGRFLMDASEAKIQKMICPNTKCKARLSIDTIKDGATIVSEIENE